MYLTQLKLPRTRQAALLLTRFMGSKYHEHQVLWELSGRAPDERRDFLYRAELTDKGLSVLVLSAKPFTNVQAPWQAEVKEYAPTLQTGQLVAFQLRVAMLSDLSTGDGARSARTDVIMQRYQALDGALPVNQVGLAVAQEWLAAREAQGGFKLVEVSFDGYTRHKVTEKGAPFMVPASDLTGLVEITNPEQFLKKQLQGYGRNKFAGLGLMLVRRPF